MKIYTCEKVKVSSNLVAIGAVGVTSLLYLVHRI